MEMKCIFFVEVSPIDPPFKVIFSSFINVNMNIESSPNRDMG